MGTHWASLRAMAGGGSGPLRVRAKINLQMIRVQAPTQQGPKIKEYLAYSAFSQRR